jgi:hypothetical protein
MKNKILITQDFAKNLKMYSENKKSLAKKVLNLKIHIENF